MRHLTQYALFLLVACSSSTAPSATRTAPFAVHIIGQSSACYVEIFSPVSFTAQIAIGTERADTIQHTPGRFPLNWHVSYGIYDASSGAMDSADVPGGFTLVC